MKEYNLFSQSVQPNRPQTPLFFVDFMLISGYNRLSKVISAQQELYSVDIEPNRVRAPHRG